MRIVTVYNQKGGVGKTTMSWLMGEALTFTKLKTRVLLIDNDEQCNLTRTILGMDVMDKVSKEHNLFNVVSGASIIDNIYETSFHNISIVPGSEALRDEHMKIEFFTKAIKELDELPEEYKFNFIVIDNGPKMDNKANATLLAADLVLIPFASDLYSFDRLPKVVKHIQDNYGTAANKIRIVPSMLKNTASALSYLNAARKLFKDLVTQIEIPASQDVESAKKRSHSLFLKKTGAGKTADAYISLVSELFGVSRVDIISNLTNEKNTIKKEISKLNFKKMREAMNAK